MGWFARLPRQAVGKPIAARTLNQTAETAELASRLRVVAPLSLSMTAAGPLLRWLGQQETVYFCQPSSSVSGATGTWPSITPASFTADVYQASRATLTKYVTSATIYNWYAASLDANKTTNVKPDGSGAFVAIAESCT
jgi:hypothetical protein